MANLLKTNRRNFLKIAATAGGGLFLGFYMGGCESPVMAVVNEEDLLDGALNFNSYLSVSPTGQVIIFSPNPE